MAANLSFQLLLAKFFTFSSPSKALAFSSTASSESSASAGLLSPPPPPAAFLGLALAPAGFFAPPGFAVPGFWELEWNETFEMTMVYNFVTTDRSQLITQRPTSYIKRLQEILVWPTENKKQTGPLYFWHEVRLPCTTTTTTLNNMYLHKIKFQYETYYQLRRKELPPHK